MSAFVSLMKLLATLSAALFAGAALYINLAEHPARLELETRQAALQWAPSYERATFLQAPLAIVSFLCGIAVALIAGERVWLLPAFLIGAVVPFTLVVIMPTNRNLLAADRDLATDGTRALLVKWGRLHAVRTVLSLAAASVYIWLLVGV
jgi:uncharacterized membrane protein